MAWVHQHGADFLLVLLRVLPVVLLSPLLGGTLVTGPVRFSVGIVGAVWIKDACGVAGGNRPAEWVALAGEQLVVGTVMGLATSWSFDAASSAGRWIDIFRGSSAEVSNPASGARDSATGALLHRLLLASASATGATTLLLGEVARSFRWCPPGQFSLSGDVLERWVAMLAATFEASVVIAAPFAVIALSVDLGVAFLQRIAPAMPLAEAGLPSRLLIGGLLCGWDLLPALSRLLSSNPSLEKLLAGGAP